MSYLLITIYSLVTIHAFNRKREYVLATVLVGQPILKLMLQPFSAIANSDLFLSVYFLIGILSVAWHQICQKEGLLIRLSSVKVFLACIGFAAVMGVSLAYSPAREYGLSKLVDFFAVNILIVYLVLFSVRQNEDLSKIMDAIGNVSLVIGIVTVFVIFVHKGSIVARLGTAEAKEISILGINFAVSIWFGRRMGLGFLSMVFLTRLHPSKYNKARTALLLALTVLSASRGPVLSSLVAIAVIAYIRLRERMAYRNVVKYVLGVVAVVMVGFLVNLISADRTALGRLASLSDRSALSRIRLYLTSLDLVRDNPFGIGLGGFTMYVDEHRYPHNIILEIMTELGVVGFLYFLSLIFWSLVTYFKTRRLSSNPYQAVAIQYSFVVLIFGLVNAQFSGDITSNEYVWLGIALMAASRFSLCGSDPPRLCESPTAGHASVG